MICAGDNYVAPNVAVVLIHTVTASKVTTDAILVFLCLIWTGGVRHSFE